METINKEDIKKLKEFARWCLVKNIEVLFYADGTFSIEQRSTAEYI